MEARIYYILRNKNIYVAVNIRADIRLSAYQNMGYHMVADRVSAACAQDAVNYWKMMRNLRFIAGAVLLLNLVLALLMPFHFINGGVLLVGAVTMWGVNGKLNNCCSDELKRAIKEKYQQGWQN